MYGMDISNYQAKLDLTKGTYDFCIIKATEGNGFTDASFYRRAAELLSLDKLIGVYHFARPDLHGNITGMENEARWFVKEVERAGLLEKAILVLDWETEPMDRPDLIEAWTSMVVKLTGIKPFIYGSRSKINKWKEYSIIHSYPIWIAVWPNTKQYEVGKSPGLISPESSLSWYIWQYSACGKFPGFSGNVDLDYCILSREEWISMAGGEVENTEEIGDDMQWAIDTGLFIGYSDGSYREDEPLTRGQAASLFRRYTNIVSKWPSTLSK